MMQWKATNVIHQWIGYTANSFGDTNRNIFHPLAEAIE